MDTLERSDPAGMEEPNRSVMLRFLEATELGDIDAYAELVVPDMVMEWPQSGERFVGRDNALAAMRAQPEKPQMAGEPRLIGSGDVWALVVPLRYGEEIYQYAGIYEFRGGRIARSTEFFGAPFPPAEFRAQWADPQNG